MEKCPKIILTAPSTEMSEYDGNHAIPFAAGFSKPWFIPRFFLKKFFFKPVRSDSIEASVAPLGIRRLEATLVKSGFNVEDIAVVHPDNLKKATGENTEIIAVSVKDPLGLGYVSITYLSLLDLGEPINKVEFERIMSDIGDLRRKYDLKVVVGGAGSWQLLRPENEEKHHVDIVFIGECELDAPMVFKKLINGKAVPKVIEGRQADVESIPLILRPSIYGSVEISRGCGRGCAFCSPTLQKRRFMPISRIIEEIKVNLTHGINEALLVTEDIFMYGVNSSSFTPNREAIKALFENLSSLSELKTIQVTHANLAAASADRSLARYVAEILREKSFYTLFGKRIATIEVGIETGSPRLMRKYMAGKCKPFKPEDWPTVVTTSLSFMEDYDWVALGTLMIGLPEEEEQDVEKTIELIDMIRDHGLRTFLVRLIFVPLGTCSLKEQALKTFNELSERQVEVFALSWEHNIKTWGIDFFKSQPSIVKIMFKIAAKLLYALKYRRGDRWRKSIADRVLETLKSVM